jgi:threonine-phosphate decarboxylase
MPNNRQNFHGSDLEKVALNFNIDKEEIINFSSNVNPLGLSDKLKNELSSKIELIATYPDRDYLDLRTSLSNYINIAADSILVGNGSTELISLFIKAVSPQKALIIGPTYSEYEREIFIGGGSSCYYRLSEKHDFNINVEDLKRNLTSDTDLLVICNPNNPTSTAICKNDLRVILDYCKEKHIFVLIDETYVEFVEDINKISAVSLTSFYNNLFIIRGVSKFFAAPGLRLGYGICGNKEFIRKINSLKNPWTINSLAAYAGELMIQDTEYITKTRNLIKQERDKITNELSSWESVKVYDPTANFILVKIINNNITSKDVFELLISKKMLIRNASSFPFLNEKYFRFCFLNPFLNDKLLEELKLILK